MRIRTLALAGAAAAAIAYLLDPREGRARRERLRARARRFVRSQRHPIGSHAPLPENVAPRPTVPAGPTTERREPVPHAPPLPGGAAPVPKPITDDAVDDPLIVRRVKTKLEERRDLRTGDLVVDVIDGMAYLSGDLPDRHLFGEIVDVTREVPGVRGVQSLLHLPDSETVTRTISARRAGHEGIR
ncbi:MAG: BON domain-containing protein [Actinomycetota bacterium]